MTRGAAVKGIPTWADCVGNVTAIWLLGATVPDCSTLHPAAMPINVSSGSTKNFENWDWDFLPPRAATSWYSTPERMLLSSERKLGGPSFES